MTKIIGMLGLTLTVAIAAHSSAGAQMGDPCQTSGAPVDLDIPRAKDANFTDLPEKVQTGMAEHLTTLGVDPKVHGDWLPDCYGNLESGWACSGDGWWCTCFKIGGEWECGCETGSC